MHTYFESNPGTELVAQMHYFYFTFNLVANFALHVLYVFKPLPYIDKIRLFFKKNSCGILEIIRILNLYTYVDTKEKVPKKLKKINLVES